MMAKKIKDRVLGSLYGVAVGDALGGPVEFMDQQEILGRYGVVKTMLGGGWLNLKPGETTDDTAMTLAVAEGIQENPLEPVGPVGQRFIDWIHSGPKDVGGTCSSAISRAEKLLARTPDIDADEAWSKAGQQTAKANGGRSGGNGALMRTAPVGCAYNTNAECNQYAREIAEMTHADKKSTDICVAYSRAIRYFTEGQDDKGREELRALQTYVDRIEDGRWIRPTGWVVDSMACALAAMETTNADATASIILAVNYGGDADTIGAITGGLVGAMRGAGDIDIDWIIALPKDVRDRIWKFAEFCCGE